MYQSLGMPQSTLQQYKSHHRICACAAYTTTGKPWSSAGLGINDLVHSLTLLYTIQNRSSHDDVTAFVSWMPVKNNQSFHLWHHHETSVSLYMSNPCSRFRYQQVRWGINEMSWRHSKLLPSSFSSQWQHWDDFSSFTLSPTAFVSNLIASFLWSWLFLLLLCLFMSLWWGLICGAAAGEADAAEWHPQSHLSSIKQWIESGLNVVVVFVWLAAGKLQLRCAVTANVQ